MTTIDVKNTSGKKAGSAELAASVFEIEPNMHAMHEVVRSQRAARRAGTHNTLTRGQVRGGGKKPWRQKGTGRARQGTIRAPQWAGGGTVFGPHPRSYAFKVPSKVIKLAMRSALLSSLTMSLSWLIPSRSTSLLRKKQLRSSLSSAWTVSASRSSLRMTTSTDIFLSVISLVFACLQHPSSTPTISSTIRPS